MSNLPPHSECEPSDAQEYFELVFVQQFSGMITNKNDIVAFLRGFRRLQNEHGKAAVMFTVHSHVVTLAKYPDTKTPGKYRYATIDPQPGGRGLHHHLQLRRELVRRTLKKLVRDGTSDWQQNGGERAKFQAAVFV